MLRYDATSDDAALKLKEFEERAKTEEAKAGYRMMQKMVPVIEEVLDDLQSRNLSTEQLQLALDNSVQAIGCSLAAVLSHSIMQIPPECDHSPPCAWLFEAQNISSLLAMGSARYFAECFKSITETVGHA